MRALRSCFVPLALALIAVTGAACRDSGGGDDGVNPNPDARDGDSSNPDDMKIQEVQAEATPVGTAVTLRGVVVVAIDKYGNRTGNFYVAEPEGGERSGVLVFGAPLAQVDTLAVGDLVDITDAEKDEFGLMTDDGTITEVVGAAGGMMTVTKVGTGPLPAPHTLDALAIGRMPVAEREAEQEKWEHVLVKVENVTVTRELRPISGANPDPTFKDFLVTGYWNIDSSLAEVPDMHVAKGDCLASVTGMGDYFFNYKILPRATADIVKNGTGCPAPETTVAECGDMIDNDANGFADCMDNSCRAAVPSCTASTTVEMIQTGTIAAGSMVSVSNVFVMAVSRDNKNLWVSDTLQAAPNKGIYVFRGTAAGVAVLPANIVPGARVNVVGVVDEFNMGGGTGTLTEIKNPTVTFMTAPAGAPVPITGVPTATLYTDATGEPYEGALVEITNVRLVDMLPVTFGVRKFGINGATPALDVVQFESDDDIRVQLTEDENVCYARIRGIWSYQVFDDRWAILPLAGATDIMTGGTCP